MHFCKLPASDGVPSSFIGKNFHTKLQRQHVVWAAKYITYIDTIYIVIVCITGIEKLLKYIGWRRTYLVSELIFIYFQRYFILKSESCNGLMRTCCTSNSIEQSRRNFQYKYHYKCTIHYFSKSFQNVFFYLVSTNFTLIRINQISFACKLSLYSINYFFLLIKKQTFLLLNLCFLNK